MSNQVLCPHCNSSLNDTDKFCPHCGKKVESNQGNSTKVKSIVCSSCGSVNPSGNNVCEGCGAELTRKDNIPNDAIKQASKQASSKKSQKKNTSPSTYVLGGFLVLVCIFIVLEFRNSPASHISDTDTPIPQQMTGNSPSLLNEIMELENTIKADPKNSDALLQLANKLHDAKFYPRAIESYKKFLLLKPNSPDARVDLGICYFESDDSKQAIMEIESALKIEPAHQMAMFNLGIIQLSSGNLPEAKKWFKKCIDIDSASTAGQRAQELLHQH